MGSVLEKTLALSEAMVDSPLLSMICAVFRVCMRRERLRNCSWMGLQFRWLWGYQVLVTELLLFSWLALGALYEKWVVFHLPNIYVKRQKFTGERLSSIYLNFVSFLRPLLKERFLIYFRRPMIFVSFPSPINSLCRSILCISQFWNDDPSKQRFKFIRDFETLSIQIARVRVCLCESLYVSQIHLRNKLDSHCTLCGFSWVHWCVFINSDIADFACICRIIAIFYSLRTISVSHIISLSMLLTTTVSGMQTNHRHAFNDNYRLTSV